jgi:hypothetical protein
MTWPNKIVPVVWEISHIVAQERVVVDDLAKTLNRLPTPLARPEKETDRGHEQQ